MEWDEVGKEGKAELIQLDPLIDETGEEYIPLMYHFPYGSDDLKVDQNSVLVRPFYNVLKEGKPMGTISYVFYQDKEDYFILGCFVYTKGRILFFPCVTDRQLLNSSNYGDLTEKNQIVDHYSLEESLRTYHLTLENKRESGKYPKMNTVRIKEDMFLWLCFGVKSADMLETAPKTQEIRLKAHDSIDLKRRFKFIDDARGGCIFNVVKVKQEPESDYYINFEIFVSTKQSREYLPPDLIYNVSLSDYNLTKDEREQIPTRLHYALLKGFSGSLWVRVSKLKGTLKNHLVFDSKPN